MKTGIELIAEERQRQKEVEGWTEDHDKKGNDEGQLALAAASYAIAEDLRNYQHPFDPPKFWPWARKWWKPTPSDRLKELVKAGALIAAEIDRLNHQKP